MSKHREKSTPTSSKNKHEETENAISVKGIAHRIAMLVVRKHRDNVVRGGKNNGDNTL